MYTKQIALSDKRREAEKASLQKIAKNDKEESKRESDRQVKK